MFTRSIILTGLEDRQDLSDIVIESSKAPLKAGSRYGYIGNKVEHLNDDNK